LPGKTVLYCLPRAETTDDRIDAIADALEAAGFQLIRNVGDDGTNHKIVLPEFDHIDEWRRIPAGAIVEIDDERFELIDVPTDGPLLRNLDTGDEWQMDISDVDDYEITVETKETVLSTTSSGEGHDPSKVEEPPEDRERRAHDVEGQLEQTYDDLYELAQDLEIPNRSKMTKEELATAIVKDS
jgi:hypothetical protein